MKLGRMAVPLVLVVAPALAACGSEEVTSNTLPPATVGTTTTVADTAPPTAPPTVPPASPVPATTTPVTAPPTTAPATTAPPTTVPPATGWTLTDLVPPAAIQGYSGNWCCDDARSPAWPDDPAAPPADGFYATTLLEPWAPGDTTLRIRVQRLERCSALPADACFLNDDPTEMGPDPDRPRDLDVPLDALTRVVVAGFECWPADVDPPPTDANGFSLVWQNKLGTGADLGELFEAYTADYAAVIAPLLGTGADPYTNPGQFAGGPDDGFRTEAEVCPSAEAGGGPLRFAYGDAPMLLLQSVTDHDGGPLDATDLVQPAGVFYAGGVPTFMFYAGFYS